MVEICASAFDRPLREAVNAPKTAAEKLLVRLGERSYPILFGGDGIEEVQGAVADLAKVGRRVAVVTDGHVVSSQGAVIKKMVGEAPTFVVEPGERSKSLEQVGLVLDFLAGERFDRTSVLIAMGGGVIGDLAGFAAAIYLRGIDYIQVPTTLLAMVDSSVGGKTGVNLTAGKNLVGSFHQPRGVFIAPEFLRTLPAREFAAGTAEILKCGLLADAALFDRLAREPLSLASADLSSVIRRCCEIKAQIVEEDERELKADGGRALLNLGHTFGHAIEQATAYRAYLHGEAVAVGLAGAARLSKKLGLIPGDAVATIENALSAHGLPTRLSAPLGMGELGQAMARDKKARVGALRFVILRSIGEAAVRADVPPAVVLEVWAELGAV